ncbi:hypothetical protein DICPUDRAFT_36298, partial [Dictyostelium purpureum]
NVFARIKRFSITSNSLRYKFKQGTFHIDNVLKKHHMIWCIVAFLVNCYSEIRTF